MTAPDSAGSASVAELAAALADCDAHDLSHTLREGIPTFPTHSKFYHLSWPQPNDPAVMYQLLMHEHNGTHVDAPAHYIAAGPNASTDYMHQVGIRALIGSALVLDFSQDPPPLVAAEHIRAWQEGHGPIRAGDIVIFNFGWHRKWAVGDLSFLEPWPGLTRGAAEYLLELGVKAVGTDCLGLDRVDSADIPAHDVLLVNHVLIMENLANLDGLPDRCLFLAAPLKIFEGSGSPIRALAFVPRSRR